MSAPVSPASRPRLLSQLWRDRYIYILLLPSLGLLALYTIWPIMVSIYFSLLDWSGFEESGRFVGLANYQELFGDRLFWNAFKNTFIFLVLAVPIRVLLALVLAIILNQAIPFARVFRTAIFLPVVTTAAILGVVMRFVLDPTSGPINLALLQSGLMTQPLNFLGQASLALYTAVGVWVWKWLGITLIYWLAALQTVPKDLYEAAQLDGASAFRQFTHITLPLLMPFTIIITLITVVEATNVFDLLLTLTNGGPFYSTEVIDIYVYRQAFASNVPRLGYASAAALFFGICIIGISAVQMGLVALVRRRTAGAA